MERNNQGKATAAAIIAALILSVGLIVGLSVVNAEPAASAPAKKTLTRGEDPVVILPGSLKPVEGSKIKHLAVFRYSEGKFEPIPFQVDERGGDGRFIYTAGPQGKGGGDGEYKGKDELVFMAWDTGDQAPDKNFPCKADDSAEVMVTDGSGKAWVYVVECDDDAPAPRSKVDYVRQEADSTHDWVRTDRYHFAERKGQSFFDRLCLRGSNGKVGANLIDRLKGRTNITALGGLVKLSPGEESVSGGLTAWIDGPVRVIHLMTTTVGVSAIKIKFGAEAQNVFYSNFFYTPITFSVPVSPSSFASSLTMRYSIDWGKAMNGARYYDPVNKAGVTLDGKMSPEEKALNLTTPRYWWGVTGPQGNFMMRLNAPAQWKSIAPTSGYYVDDLAVADPPEGEPGQRCPGIIIDLIKGQAGSYNFTNYYMMPSAPMPGAASAMNAIIDKPLKVSAKELD